MLEDAGGALVFADEMPSQCRQPEAQTEAALVGASDIAGLHQRHQHAVGRAGFNRLMAILAGTDPAKNSALPSPIITKDNVVKYYDEESVF